jgi:hypothetical protein
VKEHSPFEWLIPDLFQGYRLVVRFANCSPMHPGRPCDVLGKVLLSRLIQDANAVIDGWSQCFALLLAHAAWLNPECLHERRFRAKSEFRSFRSTNSLITRHRNTSAIESRPVNGM